tara:strand:+ start:70 stop:456 length:387 start_codon:yes stop_codon:yes gene_type:complete
VVNLFQVHILKEFRVEILLLMAALLSLPEVEVVVDLTILLDPLITLVMLVVQAVVLVIRHQLLDMEQEILHRHHHLKVIEVAALALVLVVLVAEVVLELLELMEAQDLLEEMGERVLQMFMHMGHRIQ